MTRWKVLSVLVVACLASNVAHADPKDDARRHFAAGLQAAADGNYEIALQRFLAAQAAFPHPATLYNIAKSYTDLDDLPNALTYYRLFRDASPERADEVDPIIAVLEARLGADDGVVDPGAGGGVVAGPTTEELARLQSIARELDALSEALQVRATEDAAADDDPEAGTDPVEDDEIGVIADAGFLEEAYQRIVVTASRVGQEPLDSPSTVSVLTADDIRLSGVTNLGDLLRRVVGVDVMNLTAGQPDVSIRGFNNKLNNKVLVLIDGRSTYLDFIGADVLVRALPIVSSRTSSVSRSSAGRGPRSMAPTRSPA